MKVVSQLEIEFTLPENNLNLHSQIVIRQEILTVIRRKPSNNQVNSSLKIKNEDKSRESNKSVPK